MCVCVYFAVREVCIKTKKQERNMSALPGASVPITLRQNRRIHHTVDGTQTFPGRVTLFHVNVCTTRQHIHTTDEDSTGTRALAPGYLQGCLQGRSCGISRDTDVTSKVTRCLDTFRNMRGRISFFLAISFRMSEGRDTCSPSSRCIKNVLAPFYINDTSPRVQL